MRSPQRRWGWGGVGEGASRRLGAAPRGHGAAEPGGAGNSCGGVVGGSAALLRDPRAARGRGGPGRRAGGREGWGARPAAAAAAAVLIPAARRSSGRGASQMACPVLGLEALQPLQLELPSSLPSPRRRSGSR